MMKCIQRFGCHSMIIGAMAVSFYLPSLYAEAPFDYFQNSWNVIGLKDYNDGTRITPDNQLLLGGGERFSCGSAKS